MAGWSPISTRLLRLVPSIKPEPTFCFCSNAPPNFEGLPVMGSVTVPLKRPLAVLTVRDRLFSPRLVILFFVPQEMSLLNGVLRLPALKAIVVPVSSSNVALGSVGRTNEEPTAMVSLVKPPG